MSKSLYKHGRSPRGRYFMSQKQMAEYRWSESLMFARAKRENREIKSYTELVCGCGCGAVAIERNYNYKPLPVPPKPQPKQPTKRVKPSVILTHPMFSGYVSR